MLRHLHAELADAPSPRRPQQAGGIIDSALAPLSGAESPLQIPEEEFNTVEGEAFQLGRMDRIVCGVLVEGKRLSSGPQSHSFHVMRAQNLYSCDEYIIIYKRYACKLHVLYYMI